MVDRLLVTETAGDGLLGVGQHLPFPGPTARF